VKERDVTNGCKKGEEKARQAGEGEEDRGTPDFEEEEVALAVQRSVLKRRWLV
jgi:hypothetical protein